MVHFPLPTTYYYIKHEFPWDFSDKLLLRIQYYHICDTQWKKSNKLCLQVT